MKTIVFINEKGGVGKTSLCFHTAWEMAKKQRILLVDMDGQKANITFFCGARTSEDTSTIVDVLQSLKETKDCVVSVKTGLDLIPATVKTAHISSALKISKMRGVIKNVQDQYDYLFIDVNPSPSWAHVLALSVADYCIIPMLPDLTSLQGGKGIAESIEEIRETTNPELKVLGVAINRSRERLILTREVLKIADMYAAQLGSSVFNTRIREAVVVGESVNEHKGVTDYAPASNASADIRSIIGEIEERINGEV